MNASSQSGFFSLGNIGSALFGTPSLDLDDDQGGGPQSDLLHQKALSELEAEYSLASSGSREDGSAPASQLSRIYARRFLQALPVAYQPTDVYFNRRGDAVLEWHPSPGIAASVIIGGTGILRFASTRFGTRTAGAHYLTGSVPEEVLQAVKRGGLR